MRTIEVDFDIHQLIELERRNFEETPNDVLRRLLGLSGPNTAEQPSSSSTTSPEVPIKRQPRLGEVKLLGKTSTHRSGREAMTIVLRELAKMNLGFLERCYHDPRNAGRKRRHIARSLNELYPDRPDLRNHHERLPGGWFVGTNISNLQKRNVIRMAAECADLKIGIDIAIPALGINRP